MNAGVLIGIAALAYWWWTTQSSTSTGAAPAGAPSDAVPLPTSISSACGSGSYTWYSPSSKWAGCGPATATQLAAGQAYVNSLSATSSTSTSTASTSTPVGNNGAATVTAVPTLTPAALTAAVVAGQAAGDPAITCTSGSCTATPYVLAYYLQNVAAPGLKSTNLNLSAAFPGIDLTQQMSTATFLAGIAPFLPTYSLSGVRGMGRPPVQVSRPMRTVTVKSKGGWAT